jgi:hypothetical protein
MSSLDDSDYAAFVLTADDISRSRGRQSQTPRDNVLFELGLFMGRLGRDRTFIVQAADTPLRLPSDLDGITVLRTANRPDSTTAAVSPVCGRISQIAARSGLSDHKSRDFELQHLKSRIDIYARSETSIREKDLEIELLKSRVQLLETSLEETRRYSLNLENIVMSSEITVRYDGIYSYGHISNSQPHYIRFFPKGIATMVSMKSDPITLAMVLSSDSPYSQKGRYHVNNFSLTILVDEPSGVIRYVGQILNNKLTLARLGKPGDVQESRDYTFMRMTFWLAEPSSYYFK